MLLVMEEMVDFAAGAELIHLRLQGRAILGQTAGRVLEELADVDAACASYIHS